MQHVWITTLLIVGAGTFLWGLFLGFRSWASCSWPTVTGEILESHVHDAHEPGSHRYTFHVKYRYRSHEEWHISTRLRFGLRSGLTKEDAEVLAERYATGQRVTVYHHPSKPIAVLEPGLTTASMFMITLGAVVTALTLWMEWEPQED